MMHEYHIPIIEYDYSTIFSHNKEVKHPQCVDKENHGKQSGNIPVYSDKRENKNRLNGSNIKSCEGNRSFLLLQLLLAN